MSEIDQLEKDRQYKYKCKTLGIQPDMPIYKTKKPAFYQPEKEIEPEIYQETKDEPQDLRAEAFQLVLAILAGKENKALAAEVLLIVARYPQSESGAKKAAKLGITRQALNKEVMMLRRQLKEYRFHETALTVLKRYAKYGTIERRESKRK
jgi:hypothetical protein